ncbi:protease stability complex PrcB-like protein [Flavobacterium sp. 270]|uniref:protease complex subunit PrcB family protein n=1 Tax=Flavobacterium sp. 270 TaxID=2512114 RepID=UPI001066417A|nr:protease complex subunit PrcB family protein [Flavobacterium sp. 270]TDW47380.1 protease stability complex PrcB-like protein [Flavobacterium sp. 270]
MKKLMLSLFIALGISGCSLNNDDMNVDCGAYTDLAFTGFPLPCNYTVKTLPTNPTAIVVASQEKLDQYFDKHSNSCSVAADPTIDFTKYYLVGIFAGIKSTDGYAIKITTVVENKCQVVINFYEKSPLSGENITAAPSYPSDYILIPKTTKQILFNKTTESSDNAVIGTYGTANTFYQINDFNYLKFLNVVTGKFNFNEYQYNVTPKRGEYTAFLKTVPTEILNLKGQTKTYGTPDPANAGNVYFELRQGSSVTKIYIDANDTPDQNTEIKIFKKAIKDKFSAATPN